MENPNDSNGFRYSYSAKEQAELKKIREKYTDTPIEPEDKMARLRRLDRGVTKRAQILSLILGIVGTLILGSGMSLCMTDLAETLGLGGNMPMLVGILVGVLGGILAALAYPIYNATVKRLRKKIAPEILRLTNELMK